MMDLGFLLNYAQHVVIGIYLCVGYVIKEYNKLVHINGYDVNLHSFIF